jgi:hypothetical protein
MYHLFFLKKVGRRLKIKVKQIQTLSLTSQAHMPNILENGASMLTQPGSTACPAVLNLKKKSIK